MPGVVHQWGREERHERRSSPVARRSSGDGEQRKKALQLGRGAEEEEREYDIVGPHVSEMERGRGKKRVVDEE